MAAAGAGGGPGEPPKHACRDAAVQLATCMDKSSPCVREGGGIMDCLKKGELGDCEVRGVLGRQRARRSGTWGAGGCASAGGCALGGRAPAPLHRLAASVPAPSPLCPPQGQRRAYFECRRSQLDMRTRIRGKKFSDFG